MDNQQFVVRTPEAPIRMRIPGRPERIKRYRRELIDIEFNINQNNQNNQNNLNNQNNINNIGSLIKRLNFDE